MKITRQSILTGKEHTLDIPVTEEQLKAFEDGELIQRAMPNLSSDDREFILNGITKEEWDELNPVEETPGAGPADNIMEPPITVKHSDLQRVSLESNYRSLCPKCKFGYLLVMRSKVDPHYLLSTDACNFCGQHFIYSDIPDNKIFLL